MDNGKEIKQAWENLIKVLPDWAKDKANIFLLGDQELIIHQAKNVPVHIKKDRCVQCGECCLSTPKGHTPFGSDDKKKCNALYRDGNKWLCKAGPNRPFRCLSDPIKANVPGCKIRYY